MNREILSRRLIQLGDMMSDGLHHETDGKYIESEYKKVMEELYPEIKKTRIERIKKLNNILAKEIIEKRRCIKCKGNLFQKRKGTKIIYCTKCHARFEMITR